MSNWYDKYIIPYENHSKLSLKLFVMARDRRCRAITGYGTIGNQSMWQSFLSHVKIQMKGITRIFHKTDHYHDSEDNLVKKE